MTALATPGCALVVGVDDFSVAQGSAGSASTGMMSVDPCADVHGCTRAGAEDHTGSSGNTIGVQFSKAAGYEPACIRIRKDMLVNFNGFGATFEDIPIQGGINSVPDTESPIQQPSDPTVTEVTIPFTSGCGFPYYSPGMGDMFRGVVYVGG